MCISHGHLVLLLCSAMSVVFEHVVAMVQDTGPILTHYGAAGPVGPRVRERRCG